MRFIGILSRSTTSDATIIVGLGARGEGPAVNAQRPLFLGEATLPEVSSSDAELPKAAVPISRFNCCGPTKSQPFATATIRSPERYGGPGSCLQTGTFTSAARMPR